MLDYIPWMLSVMTLVNMWLAGNKSYWAWVFGLAGQSLWFVYALNRATGLLPGVVILTFVYARNLRR
jgi:hypothetical protein